MIVPRNCNISRVYTLIIICRAEYIYSLAVAPKVLTFCCCDIIEFD